LGVLAATYILWNYTLIDLAEQDEFRMMESSAIDVFEQILRTPGEPLDWDHFTVSYIGLASESRVLNETKVSSFLYMMNDSIFDSSCGVADESNYDCFKGLMGLGDIQFEMAFYDLGGALMVVDSVSAGTGREAVNETMMLTLHRTAILGGEITDVVLTVWKSE